MVARKLKLSKKACGIIGLATALLLGCQASYGFLVIDIPKLAKWMETSTQKYDKYVKMYQNLQKRFHLKGNSANSKIEAMQNDAANEIARETQNRDQLFNEHLKMAMQPDPNACSSFNISGALSSVECAFLGSFHQAASQSTAGLMSGSKQNGFDDTLYTYQQTVKLGSLTPQQQQQDTNAATFENVSQTSLTPEQAKSAKNFVYLVSPKPNLPYDPRMENTLIGQKFKMRRLQKIARAQAPSNVLNSVVMANESINGNPSVERMISQTGQQVVINPKNILTINEGNKMTPAAVNRSRAVAIAYQNYLLVQQYKADLKKEFMYSNMLILLQSKDKHTGDQT